MLRKPGGEIAPACALTFVFASFGFQVLLGDMDTEVERTAESIKLETQHAKDVTDAGGTFWMYMVILVLVVIMVLEIIIGVQ